MPYFSIFFWKIMGMSIHEVSCHKDLDVKWSNFLLLIFQRLKEQLKLHQQQQAANSSNIIHRAMTEAVDMVTSQHNGIPSPGSHMNHSHHPTTIVANSNMSVQDSKRGTGAS